MLKRVISFVLVGVMTIVLFACGGGKVIERTGNEALGMLQWKIDKTETAVNNVGANTILIYYTAEIKDEYKSKYKLKEIKYASCDDWFVPEYNLSNNKFCIRFMHEFDGKYSRITCKDSDRETFTQGIGVNNGSLKEFEYGFNSQFPINSSRHSIIEPPNYINDIRVEFIEK